MYRTALIQNQSEMAHYGHADCRDFFRELGYDAHLYTGGRTANVIRTFAESGGGIVIFHQLRLAQDNCSEFPFLPDDISILRFEERPRTESATAGVLQFGPAGQRNNCALYPNEIVLDQVLRHTIACQSLPGTYWHFVSAFSADHWDVLIEDNSSADHRRQLVLLTKDTTRFRVVISALPIDWQHHAALAKNLCVYAIEGSHPIAIIKDPTAHNDAFDYVLATVDATKLPHRVYLANSDHADFMRNIDNNVHSEFIFGPSVLNLPHALSDAIERKTRAGLVKTIHFDTPPVGRAIGSFSITGRERFARRLLSHIELRLVEELTRGYIDQSFWSTVESFDCLYDLGFRQFDYTLISPTLLGCCDAHDRDGSYDEVFAASCAFLWLRCLLLGVNHERTQKSLCWIRAHLSASPIRDKAQALSTFVRWELASPDELGQLKRLLQQIDGGRLSESDAIIFLQASLLLKDRGLVAHYSTMVLQRQHDGRWTDLDSTATATACLLRSIQFLKQDRIDTTLEQTIKSVIFSGIIQIRSALPKPDQRVTTRYPWPGKASTNLKCLRAWAYFDDFVDFPANELIDALTKLEVLSRIAVQGAQNISVLRSIIDERNRLLEDRSRLSIDHEKFQKEAEDAAVKLVEIEGSVLPRTRRQRNFFFIGLVVSVYLVAVLLFSIFWEEGTQARAVLRYAIVDLRYVHLYTMVLMFTVLRTPWDKIINKIMARRSEADSQ
jgi:hypothetical protein